MTGELFAVGLNHTCAPVEMRERFAVADHDQLRVVAELSRRAGLREAMLLSTCNRVEIYGVADDWSTAARSAVVALAELRTVAVSELDGHSFVRGGEAAVRHIFRVAASLDSMIVGEPQILGQVKSAFQLARDGGCVGPVLDRCLMAAFHAAKRVRSETEIARGAASVPSVAVDLARSIFGDLAGSAALIVGAGEMAEQAGEHLRGAGVSELVVVNRSQERGIVVAERIGGWFAAWDQLDSHLRRADVVVTSTGSERPVIDRGVLKPVMRARRQRPLFLVDIAVPRDVDASAASLDHVFLYNIDDLQGIVHDNLRVRATEAERAQTLLEQDVAEFIRWQRTRTVGPLIGRLHERGREVVDAELAKALRRLGDLPAEQRAVMEQMAHTIARKLLHTPVSTLRDAAATGSEAALADAIASLYGLREAASPVDVSESAVATEVPEPS